MLYLTKFSSRNLYNLSDTDVNYFTARVEKPILRLTWKLNAMKWLRLTFLDRWKTVAAPADLFWELTQITCQQTDSRIQTILRAADVWRCVVQVFMLDLHRSKTITQSFSSRWYLDRWVPDNYNILYCTSFFLWVITFNLPSTSTVECRI